MTDRKKIALEELFHKDNEEIIAHNSALGDYEVRLTDKCLTAKRRNAVRLLGFDLKSTHAHVTDDDMAEISLFVGEK